jgi:hypothetical protein
MEEEADLGEYGPLVMTTLQLVDVLEADAILDRQTSDRVRHMLAPLEQRAPLGTNKAGEEPLFLDGLAVAYLSGTGILDDLHRSAREFRLHPSTVTELEQLIGTEADSERTLDVLSQLWWLPDGRPGPRYRSWWSPRPVWAVSVSGNWRLVFEFEGENATDVDLVDYH